MTTGATIPMHDRIEAGTTRDSYQLDVRGLRYHIRRWGDPAGRPLVLLHGARDCGATFQFMIEALTAPWDIHAVDWRGHGLSSHAAGSYWVHEFLADLDVVLDSIIPNGPVDIVAHSMGGNVTSLYCGLRPDRVRRFVSLDAAGPMARRLPVDPYRMLTDWLDVRQRHGSAGYETLDEVAGRLRKANRRLSAERAAFLAQASTAQGTDGRWRWLFDPTMRQSFPSLHTVEEWQQVWAHIRAPVLWIGSTDQRPEAPSFDDATIAARRRLLPHAEFVRLDDTGHNLHHDRPEDVAGLVEEFLLR